MLGQKGGAASHRTQPLRAERQDSRSGGCTGPPDFISRQGRRTASKEADVLLAQTAAETVIANKGYDAQAQVLGPLSAQGKGVVIVPRNSKKAARDYNPHLYQAPAI